MHILFRLDGFHRRPKLLEEALPWLRDSIQHLHRVMEYGRSALVQE